jgi:hypothetical protein
LKIVACLGALGWVRVAVGLFSLAGCSANGVGETAPNSTPPAEAAQLTQMVITLNGRYQKAAPTERAEALSQLMAAAIRREQLLGQLMEKDPKEVLRVAMSSKVRGALSPQVQAHVEEEVDVEGTIEILHEDRDPGSRYLYFLRVGPDKLSLHFAGRPPTLLTDARVRVRGIRLGRDIALE